MASRPQTSPVRRPGLPVDVSIGGACALPNLTFGQIVGPLHVPPGTYAVAVHFPATGRCTSPAVIGPAQVPLNAGENATVLAHLTGSGGLTASKFVNNLTPTPAGRARVTIVHAANAPAVDLYLTTQFGNLTATRGLATSVVNGETATVPVAGSSTQFAITAAGVDCGRVWSVDPRPAAEQGVLVLRGGLVGEQQPGRDRQGRQRAEVARERRRFRIVFGA